MAATTKLRIRITLSSIEVSFENFFHRLKGLNLKLPVPKHNQGAYQKYKQRWLK